MQCSAGRKRIFMAQADERGFVCLRHFSSRSLPLESSGSTSFQHYTSHLSTRFSEVGLRGPWKPHPQGPIRQWIHGSRQAGRPVRFGGHWYRFGQDCEVTYGHRVGGTMGMEKKDSQKENIITVKMIVVLVISTKHPSHQHTASAEGLQDQDPFSGQIRRGGGSLCSERHPSREWPPAMAF